MQRTEAAAGGLTGAVEGGKRRRENHGAAARRSRAVKLTREDKLLSVLKVTGGFEQAREEEERPAW